MSLKDRDGGEMYSYCEAPTVFLVSGILTFCLSASVEDDRSFARLESMQSQYGVPRWREEDVMLPEVYPL